MNSGTVLAGKAGLTTMEHWYGLPEALFTDRTIQNYPTDYNYQNEQNRFEEAGKLWKQAAPPYSEHWNKVMNELLALDFTIDPTFNIYEASRDLHRARRAEWHEEYTLPKLWTFFQPNTFCAVIASSFGPDGILSGGLFAVPRAIPYSCSAPQT